MSGEAPSTRSERYGYLLRGDPPPSKTPTEHDYWENLGDKLHALGKLKKTSEKTPTEDDYWKNLGNKLKKKTSEKKPAEKRNDEMVYRPNTQTPGTGLRRAKLGGK